jgi:hypothetical protein
MSKLNIIFPENGDTERALNSLSGFDCKQPSSSCLALLTPRACGAASLMARCATPDVGQCITWTNIGTKCRIRHLMGERRMDRWSRIVEWCPGFWFRSTASGNRMTAGCLIFRSVIDAKISRGREDFALFNPGDQAKTPFSIQWN